MSLGLVKFRVAPRKTQFNCSIEGCERPARSHNLCERHLHPFKRYGDPTYSDRKKVERSLPCKVGGCDGDRYIKGYCIRHYSALERYGDPKAVDNRREERSPLGKKFGRFTVLSDLGTRVVGKRKSIKHYVVVRCECGSEPREVEISTLLSGRSQSCGCLHREIKQKPPGRAALTYILHTYKKAARNRNLEFDLSREQFADLVFSNCHYCGREPDKTTENRSQAIKQNVNGHIKWSGVDRKDNSVGYTPENCVAACTQCNMAKRDTSYNDFIEWIGRVYEHTR